jgi:hypothetical protein
MQVIFAALQQFRRLVLNVLSSCPSAAVDHNYTTCANKKAPEGAFLFADTGNYFATTRTISRHLLE